jgi:hypothetical protein
MPSTARGEFDQNLTDVKRIVRLHDALSRPAGARRRGKRALGHLTRGGLVLLCAAWERYAESVLEEAAAFVARRNTLASLHASPKKFVTDFVNGGKSTISYALLAANLETAMTEAVRAKTAALNTPKHKNLKPLFERVLHVADIAAAWSEPHTTIDNFVSLRGEVAHRGGQAGYVRISGLRVHVETIGQFVTETDNYLSDHVRTLVVPSRRPWNRG